MTLFSCSYGKAWLCLAVAIGKRHAYSAKLHRCAAPISAMYLMNVAKVFPTPGSQILNNQPETSHECWKHVFGWHSKALFSNFIPCMQWGMAKVKHEYYQIQNPNFGDLSHKNGSKYQEKGFGALSKNMFLTQMWSFRLIVQFLTSWGRKNFDHVFSDNFTTFSHYFPIISSLLRKRV